MRRSLYLLGLILLPLSFLWIFPIACGPSPTSPVPTPTPSGPLVTTLAGSGSPGSTNATGTAASFNYPIGVAVDSSGNVYIADSNNNLIRKISSGGVVTTLAGQAGVTGATNATGTAASFNHPSGVAVDSSGNVYVADDGNNLIRKITTGGVVTTLAGSGSTGSTNATGTAASFNQPYGVAVDSSGNVYVADFLNSLIRAITSGGVVSTLAGSGSIGSTNATGTAASFNRPTGVAVDSSGNIYVADYANSLIREIRSWGSVSTLAGQTGVFGSTNGTGSAASFYFPTGVAVDTSGNVYVADEANSLIRKITWSGVVSTLAASFNNPMGVAVDTLGNVYVADTSNNLIRKITQ